MRADATAAPAAHATGRSRPKPFEGPRKPRVHDPFDHSRFYDNPLESVQLPGCPTRRPLRGRAGDVLLVRVRGCSVNATIEDNLRSLGLSKVNDRRVLDSANPRLWNQVCEAWYALRIVPLAVGNDGGSGTRDGHGRSWLAGGHAVSVPTLERYGDSPADGAILAYPSGDYVQVDHGSDGRTSLLWSSAAPLATIIDRIDEIAGALRDAEQGVVIVEDARHRRHVAEGTSKDLHSYVLEEATDAVYASLQYEAFSLVWRAPFRKFSSQRARLAETSVIAESLPVDMAQRLIHRTGTPAVAETSDEAVDRLDLRR